MNIMTVTAHDPGDYLHADQKLELVEEGSGRRYEILLRGNARATAGVGEISLFLPLSSLSGIQANGDYFVVTLATPRSSEEAVLRQKKLEGFRLDADPAQVKK